MKICGIVDARNVFYADLFVARFLFTIDAGRAGVPMEVMGLMLGQFVDDYTVKVVDVFAMRNRGRAFPLKRSTRCSRRKCWTC